MIIPMIKGQQGARFTTWHFDSKISTIVGLGASGTTIQYSNEFPLLPALICEVNSEGTIVALDFTSILLGDIP